MVPSSADAAPDSSSAYLAEDVDRVRPIRPRAGCAGREKQVENLTAETGGKPARRVVNKGKGKVREQPAQGLQSASPPSRSM